MPHSLTPFLWFDGNVEEPLRFYTSVFSDSEVVSTTPAPDGTLMSATFRLHGQELIAFNAGPEFKFNEAISFFVSCNDQAEVDDLWEKLSTGGEEGRCGWLKDRFGLSWQIVPRRFIELLADENPKKVKAVLDAMMQMVKLEVAELEKAHAEA
jgi:predicted 3-demethylubiquinone-9 3-methyltransferase (glyoxalase superfamily)